MSSILGSPNFVHTSSTVYVCTKRSTDNCERYLLQYNILYAWVNATLNKTRNPVVSRSKWMTFDLGWITWKTNTTVDETMVRVLGRGDLKTEWSSLFASAPLAKLVEFRGY